MRQSLTTLLIGITAGLSFAPVAGATYPLTFPARGESLDDLGYDAYFSSGGHVGGYGTGGSYPIDTGIVRFDTGLNRWVDYVPGGSSTAPEDKMIYEFPVYSPVSGQIISCWREMPDNQGTCPSGQKCLGGGNHLNIITEDGDHVVYFGHLRAGSIPDELCPLADVYLDDSSQSSCGSGWEGFPASARLDTLPGALPYVQKGDYIGQAGNSGTSTSAPHLHMHVKEFDWISSNPCERVGSEELEFAESWYAARVDQENGAPADADVDVSDWIPAKQTIVPFEADGYPRYLFWPDPIGPRTDDLVWGDGDDLHNVTDSYGGVMAYRNDADQLQLESYAISTGDITAQDTKVEGAVLDIGLARPFSSSRDVVAAIRTAAGNLKLIPYDVTNGGTITRQVGKERDEGAIYKVEAVKSPTHNGVTVAIQGSTNKIKVIDYAVNSTTMAITRPGTSAEAGTVNDIAIDAVSLGFDLGELSTGPKFQGVVTAERAASNNELILRAWTVSASANVALVDTEWTGVTASQIDVATLRMGAREVVLATARDANDELWMQYYYVSSNGTLTPAEDISGGEIGALASAAVGDRDAVTVVSDSGDGLKLIAWGFNDAIDRAGGRKAGGVSEVLLDAANIPSDAPYLVTLVRSLTGEIKMLIFGSNFDPTL